MMSRKILLPILLAVQVFACSCACVSPIVSMGKWVVRKADEIASAVFTQAAVSLWEDNRTCLLDAEHPNPQVLLLKQYEPRGAGSVPVDFYTYFGFRDWWRFPLVYPYSILSIDTTDHGTLVVVGSEVDFRNPNEGVEDVGISGITHLTFDRNMLLVRAGRDKYHLFDFQTREKETFASETALFAAAKTLNFQGEYRLMTIDEYGGLFTCQE